MKKLLALAAAAAVASFAALPASAGVVSVSATTTLPSANPAGNPLAISTTGTVFENVTGSDLDAVAPNRRDPWEGTADANTGLYTSVSANSTAEYSVLASQVLTLVWGSPDQYNTLRFYDGATLVGTVFGNDGNIVPPGTAALGAVLVTIVLDQAFDRIVFSSGLDAFEFANVAVPLPGAALLLLSGVAGLGFASRRKKAL